VPVDQLPPSYQHGRTLSKQVLIEGLKSANSKMAVADFKKKHATTSVPPIPSPPAEGISAEARPIFKHLWKKTTGTHGPGTLDDWSMLGNPHPWWDRYTGAPMTNYPRFDLQETSYAVALFSRRTPAWKEIYVKMMDDLCERFSTFWGAVDFNTQFGDDPDNTQYPSPLSQLIPPGMMNQGYNIPGWTGNGMKLEHVNTGSTIVEPDAISTRSMLFFKGWFVLALGIRAQIAGTENIDTPFAFANVGDQQTTWTHMSAVETLRDQFLDNEGAGLN